MKFFKCNECDKVVFVKEDINSINCCNNEMEELIVNEDINEKHTPIVERVSNLVKIKIGKTLHSMVVVHYIKSVILETDKGIYYRDLDLSKGPFVNFLVDNEEIIKKTYVICNNDGVFATDKWSELK